MPRKRNRPADPQAIMLRNAEQRARLRQADRDPAQWGISAEITVLPTSEDVEIRRGARGKVLAARRAADAFTMLYHADGLTRDQHQASERYWADWSMRAGVRTGPADPMAPIDGAGAAELVTQSMIDAGRRIEAVHAKMGRADAQLLRNLVEPLIMLGQIRAWRGVVREVTGETDKHGQAARVRSVCENLVAAYAEIDAERDGPRRTSPRETRSD